MLSGFLSFFALFAFAQADYIIDDANSSVIYSANTVPSPWSLLNLTNGNYLISPNGSAANLDYNRFYDATA
jgi:hypothetical protein